MLIAGVLLSTFGAANAAELSFAEFSEAPRVETVNVSDLPFPEEGAVLERGPLFADQAETIAIFYLGQESAYASFDQGSATGISEFVPRYSEGADPVRPSESDNVVVDVQHASTVSPVPEPEIYALMGVGLGLLAWLGRRNRSKHILRA